MAQPDALVSALLKSRQAQGGADLLHQQLASLLAKPGEMAQHTTPGGAIGEGIGYALDRVGNSLANASLGGAQREAAQAKAAADSAALEGPAIPQGDLASLVKPEDVGAPSIDAMVGLGASPEAAAKQRATILAQVLRQPTAGVLDIADKNREAAVAPIEQRIPVLAAGGYTHEADRLKDAVAALRSMGQKQREGQWDREKFTQQQAQAKEQAELQRAQHASEHYDRMAQVDEARRSREEAAAEKARLKAEAEARKNQEKEEARTFELLGDEYHIKPGINERQANVIHNKVGAYKKVFTGLDQTERYLHQIVDPKSPSDVAEGMAGLTSTSTDVANNITSAYAGSRSARALEETRAQLGANIFSRDAAEGILNSVGGDKAAAKAAITRRLRAARELIQQNAREDLMDMTTKGGGAGAPAKSTVRVVFNPATGQLEPVK